MLSGLEYVLIALAAVAAGGVNALAGGGTLSTFPMLMWAGIPAVAANVTNTVALCPGYFGGALGGRLAGRIQPDTLRKAVVVLGVTVAVLYLAC